jgi:predicted phosphoribosyltransferase
MPFNDRFEAGQKLAKALSRYRKQQPAILALPRGFRSICCLTSPPNTEGGRARAN